MSNQNNLVEMLKEWIVKYQHIIQEPRQFMNHDWKQTKQFDKRISQQLLHKT